MTSMDIEMRVNDDSFIALIEGFRSQIGPCRPNDNEPEAQWAWDKATTLISALAAPKPDGDGQGVAWNDDADDLYCNQISYRLCDGEGNEVSGRTIRFVTDAWLD